MTVLSNVLNFFVSIFLVSTHLPQLQIKTKIKGKCASFCARCTYNDFCSVNASFA